MQRLYYGTVLVLHGGKQHTATCLWMASSKEEAAGASIGEVVKRYPGGVIVNHAFYQVLDDQVMAAAQLLKDGGP